MGSPDGIGEEKGKEEGNLVYYKTGGPNKGPPLGSRKPALPKSTSNGKAVHQEGGTGVQHMGGTTTQDPPYREQTRGLLREGRDRGARRNNKKMAKAMEEWLRMGKAEVSDARGAREGTGQRTREDKKEEYER